MTTRLRYSDLGRLGCKPPRKPRTKRTGPRIGSAPEESFATQLSRDAALAGFVREHCFDPTRRYRLDFAWLALKLGIEIQGGTWVRGMGHSSGSGIERDCEKAALLAESGWMVVPVTSKQVSSGRALEIARRVHAARRREKGERPA